MFALVKLSEKWQQCFLIFRQVKSGSVSYFSLGGEQQSNTCFFVHVMDLWSHQIEVYFVFFFFFHKFLKKNQVDPDTGVTETVNSVFGEYLWYLVNLIQIKLMMPCFKYALQILMYSPLSKFFQPLKVVDPDHPLAALVRKAQSDNNSSTPQSTDGAAVQTSQVEYSSDCKCTVIRQLVVCLDELILRVDWGT